ncbi:hypothetical protein STEG23_011104, partial [Scotinomys teguina]
MSQPAGRMHCRKAGIRAAVVLIGLLHKSRKQNKEKRKQELANSSDVTVPDRPLSPPLTAPPTMKLVFLGDSYPQYEAEKKMSRWTETGTQFPDRAQAEDGQAQPPFHTFMLVPWSLTGVDANPVHVTWSPRSFFKVTRPIKWKLSNVSSCCHLGGGNSSNSLGSGSASDVEGSLCLAETGPEKVMEFLKNFV